MDINNLVVSLVSSIDSTVIFSAIIGIGLYGFTKSVWKWIRSPRLIIVPMHNPMRDFHISSYWTQISAYVQNNGHNEALRCRVFVEEIKINGQRIDIGEPFLVKWSRAKDHLMDIPNGLYRPVAICAYHREKADVGRWYAADNTTPPKNVQGILTAGSRFEITIAVYSSNARPARTISRFRLERDQTVSKIF